jgi:hypothetical protein
MHNIIIGETCLLSYQLRRIGIIQGSKSLFEHMLVNLDGVKKLIEDEFKYILSEEELNFMYYMYYPHHSIGYTKWVNKRYTVDSDNIFSWPVFSFFHCDEFNSTQVEVIKRRCKRLQDSLKDNSTVNLFYYYRNSERFNIESIITKMKEFLLFLKEKYNKLINAFLFVKYDDITRKINITNHDNMTLVTITSPSSWVGVDDNWDGHSDNDLFDEVFKLI